MSQNQPTILQQLQHAIQLHQTGQLSLAEAIYRDVLAIDSKQADALHYLGMLLNQTGNTERAIAYIQQSILISPENAVYQSNLGTIFTRLCDHEKAAAYFRNAIALNPNFITAIINLGCALKDLKKYDDAISSFRRALAINANLPDVQNHIGEIQVMLRKFDDAEQSFQHALKISVQHVPAIINLSTSLKRKNQFEQAASLCRQALLIKPDAWGALVNLGTICFETDQYREAEQHYRNALKLLTTAALTQHGDIIHTHLGLVAMKIGRLDDAEREFKESIILNPGNYQSYVNLALAHKALGKLEEALDCLRNAIAIDADQPTTFSNYLITMLYDTRFKREEIYAEHKRYGELFERPLGSLTSPPLNNKNPTRKLRIGYVSADFWTHVVNFFFEPILAEHDKTKFHVTCFSNNNKVDSSTSRLMKLADNWVMCKDLTDSELTARIQKEKIDILIDLSGHTGDNRLPVFASRAAPVQMTWIGYASTTGLSNMDYRISDEHLDPLGVTDDIHSEVVLRLPGTGAAFNADPNSPEINILPSLNSPKFIFACLNGIYKINRDVVSLWAEILHDVPNGMLMLGNASDTTATTRMEKLFVDAGIDPSRLIFKPRLAQIDYLRLHHEIDLALDTFPYCGGTTTWHSVWMGVPVVTLAGDTPVSRCGVAVLRPIGLVEYIASSKKQYVEIAIAAAKNPSMLAKTRTDLRNRIRANSAQNPLVITKNVEGFYRAAWEAWCNGRKLSGDFSLSN